ATAADRRGKWRHPSTKSKRLSSARNAVNSTRRVWPDRETCRQSNKSSVAPPKSDATIPAPVAPARNTKNAAGRTVNVGVITATLVAGKELLGNGLGQNECLHHDVVRLNAHRNHGKQGILAGLEFLLRRTFLDHGDISRAGIQNQQIVLILRK